jgi:type II secretory pathway predicted ATPase ExeA
MNPFEIGNEKVDFVSAGQKEAYSRMMHAIETNALCVVTGEVGSGKSTLYRILSSHLPTTEYQMVYLCSAGLTPKELYSGILKSLGESPAYLVPKIKQQWQEVLSTRISGKARQLVVMIDEAHDLPTNTLLELRFLMSYGMDAKPPFPVILAGQSPLRLTLKKNLFEPIAQRIRMQYHLSGMSLEECGTYIESRMKEANLERPVFTEDAIKLIHATSQGIPRVVNLLCGHAFHICRKKEDNVIEERLIKVVIADMDKQRGNR